MLLIFDAKHRPDPMILLPIYEESIALDAEKHRGITDWEKRINAEDNFIQFVRDEFSCEEGALFLVWQEGGCLVSALRLEPYKDGYLLCGIETAPAYRRKGYAKSLLLAAADYIRSKNICSLYSHVFKQNIASLRLHETCGFTIISDSAALLDGSVSAMYYTLKLK